jgi:hypothetical protein
LSNPFLEKSDLDGQTYTVQYFERAVFELHPELAAGQNVLLSQLGTFRYQAKYNNASPRLAPPVPVPASSSAPSSGNPTPAPTTQRAPQAFGNYIAQKYAGFGTATLRFSDVRGFEQNGAVFVTLSLTPDSAQYLLLQGTRAQGQIWADDVMAEAKANWQTEDFYVSMELDGYTYDPCVTCSNDPCYYVSDSYTPGSGWYFADTYISVSRTQLLGEDEHLCLTN